MRWSILRRQFLRTVRAFNMMNLFALHDVHSAFFKPHQLVTHLFMHGSFGHLLVNMFSLWMFGSMFENLWGSKRFLIFYVVSGLGAAFLHLAVLYFEMEPVMANSGGFPMTNKCNISNRSEFSSKHRQLLVLPELCSVAWRHSGICFPTAFYMSISCFRSRLNGLCYYMRPRVVGRGSEYCWR